MATHRPPRGTLQRPRHRHLPPDRVLGLPLFDPGTHRRTRQGASGFTHLRERIVARQSRVFLNSITVRDEAGSLISEGNINDCYVVDDNSSSMANEEKTLKAPVPGLAVGTVLDYVVTWKDLSFPDTFPFTKRILASSKPTQSISVFISGDIDNVKTEHRGSLTTGPNFDGSRYWVLEQPPPYRDESHQPFLSEFVPTVWIGDSSKSWSKLAAEYQEDLRDRLEPDEQTQKLAANLTSGLETTRDKLAALARHTQQVLRYEAIEFGPRARMPNSCRNILKNKYGDCKDHSLLLHQLLAAANIESHLALIHTGGPVNRNLPSLDQFDHMIVHVPDFKDSPFIDTTDKYHDIMSKGPPLGLANRTVLIMDDDASRLDTTGPFPPGSAHWHVDRTLTIGQGDSINVSETIRVSGIGASWVRGWLAPKSTRDRSEAVQDFLDGFDDVRLKTFSAENLMDTQHPLVLRLDYEILDALDRGNSRLTFQLPGFWERYYLDVSYIPDRVNPIDIDVPLHVEGTVTINLPENHRLVSSSNLSFPLQTETPFASWQAQLSLPPPPDGDTPSTLNFQIVCPSGRWPSTDWSRLDDARAGALRIFNEPWDIKPLEIHRKPSAPAAKDRLSPVDN